MKIEYKNKLKIDFYQNMTEIVAKELLGKILFKLENNSFLSGKIVETEAYIPNIDFANHASAGLTQRTAPMFEDGGILYVYKIYGIHHCINVVTEAKGIGSAVLIRAIEPLEGIELMKERRQSEDLLNLCNGPGKIAQAFNFSKKDNFRRFDSEDLFIIENQNIKDEDIVISKRIGIKKSAELDLRFYIKNSRFISKK